MDARTRVEPLPYTTRKRTFTALLVLFLASLPFLYFYATGYKFDLSRPTNIVGTGGIYVGAERTGAAIFIDDELVRETRVFRRAFYAQNLIPGTHRVHVQKEGHHTWVKELPVYTHLVTEAQAFNFPLVSTVRVIAPWQTATGTMVATSSLLTASTTNEVLATTTKRTTGLTLNSEFETLLVRFKATSTDATELLTVRERIDAVLTQSTTTATGTPATTTKEQNNVRLFEFGDDVYARWVGQRETMPYYYCVQEFPRYSTTTEEELPIDEKATPPPLDEEDPLFIHPVQMVPSDAVCDPTIRMDRMWQTISSFEFLPGSTDHVVLALDDGVYVVEIDNRAWQNVQPLIKGDHLQLLIENGSIYVYDGTLIYQVILEQ